MYALDVAQLMGDKMPSCKETDFEQWTVPADDRTPRCLLGEHRSTGSMNPLPVGVQDLVPGHFQQAEALARGWGLLARFVGVGGMRRQARREDGV